MHFLVHTFRRLIYDELHAKAKEKEAKEIKRKKKVRDDFQSELKRCRAIKDGTTWEEAQQLLENVEIKVCHGIKNHSKLEDSFTWCGWLCSI